jgi:hypothetical protein
MHDTASGHTNPVGVATGGTSANRDCNAHAGIKVTYVMFILLLTFIWVD